MQPILKVNLSTGETSDYVIPDEWERDYLGGASLAARMLYSDPYQRNSTHYLLKLRFFF